MEQRSFFESLFNLSKHNTSVKQEVIAGLTTFLTMVYIVFVNPSILGVTGMDVQVVFITTALVAAIATILMGLFTNLPVALAPAMGLNSFFAFTVVLKLGYSWQIAMGAVFLGSAGLLILSVLQVRYWLISNIPSSLRIGITAGIGLFIALLGFQNMGLVVANPVTLVSLGNLADPKVLLGILGFLIIIVLSFFRVYSAVLISIVVITTISLMLGLVTYNGFFSLPTGLGKIVGEVDVAGALDVALLGIAFSFMLVNLFDSSGTLIAVTERAGLADQNGHFPNMKKSLYVDSASSVAGAYLGTSSVTAYIESTSGISVGGRTGLTSVVTGLLFLVVIFLSPIASLVPAYATAGALVYVGILMTIALNKIEWSDLTEATPAFITCALMPFTYSITEGIAFGFISYLLIKLATGKFSDITIPVWVISILFLVKFIFVDLNLAH